MWFDTFSVRPFDNLRAGSECRAECCNLGGVSKNERKTLTMNGGFAKFP